MTGATSEGPLSMQLTPPESALLKKLRTQERQWPAMRWLLLGLALLLRLLEGAEARGSLTR
ncbi:MAG: hypothetical protein A2190_04375 [Lysobacterales bacterium RIFOXYA1_FULL_69_10]|nr:MAG: hypothetical protein A2190_04375 [Xanthomonadales bacterium RIFOXYA1_FULL_69_10]